MRRRSVYALVVALAMLSAPAAARAETFFVSTSGSGTECTEAVPCLTVQQALTTSRAAAGTGDEIRVGPGVFEERVVIDDAMDEGLTLLGAGRGGDGTEAPPEATTLRSPETNKGAEIAIGNVPGVTLESVRVEVPAGFINNAGIDLGTGLIGASSPTVRDVHVQSSGGMNTGAIQVGTKTTEARILGARVRHLGEYWGIAVFGSGTTVADADVFTAQGQSLTSEASAKGTQIVRSRFSTEGGFVATLRSSALVDSSLFVGGSIGIETYASFGSVHSVTLANTTIDVGQPKVDDNGGFATRVRAEGGGSIAALTLSNSIAVEGQEVAGDATASVTCESSIAPPQVEAVSPGTVSCGDTGGNLFAPATSLFQPGADWRLLPGSAAVDSGAGGVILTETDLSGAPRVADGNVDGRAQIDRGAYELEPAAAIQAGPVALPPSNAFKLGKVKRNRRKGTASLTVEVPGAGRLVLAGRRVQSEESQRASERKGRREPRSASPSLRRAGPQTTSPGP
jgi:hypothetical protein